MPEVTGLYLVDKPAGPSSFAVLRGLRPVLGKKLGHAGTLDPFATGLLLVLAGRATRLAPYLAGMQKGYAATVQIGVRSTTDDPEGELEPGGAPTDRAAVADALAAFRGTIEQVPPAASAIHVGGERAYARFRRGEAVVVPTRRVVVERIELVGFDAGLQRAELEIACSTGTYVRAIARDLGEALGVGAYCRALRRTRIGSFDVAAAGTPDAIRAAPYARPHWVEPVDMLPDVPLRELSADDLAAVSHGRALDAAGLAGDVRCVRDGRLVAVARAEGGVLRPQVVLEPS